MHVDLVESLRCPNGHADGWLVVATDDVVNRRIMRGTIGCPVCRDEWRVADGALWLRARGAGQDDAMTAAMAAAIGAPDVEQADKTEPGANVAEVSTPEAALRLAAQLDLVDARGTVLLTGTACAVADALHALTGSLLILVNPPAGVGAAHSRLQCSAPLPLGVGTLRGAALDAAHADAAWLPGVLRAIAAQGRVVAPDDAAVPRGLRELARDDREWVAEVTVAASGLVPLRRAGDPLSTLD